MRSPCQWFEEPCPDLLLHRERKKVPGGWVSRDLDQLRLVSVQVVAAANRTEFRLVLNAICADDLATFAAAEELQTYNGVARNDMSRVQRGFSLPLSVESWSDVGSAIGGRFPSRRSLFPR